jgi:hypothetical protein
MDILAAIILLSLVPAALFYLLGKWLWPDDAVSEEIEVSVTESIEL